MIKKLVEANPHDIHWSCGLALKDVEKNQLHWTLARENVLGNSGGCKGDVKGTHHIKAQCNMFWYVLSIICLI